MIALRPATPADAEAVTRMDYETRLAALPTVRWAHPLPEVRAYISEVMIPAGGVILAEEDAGLVGYTNLKPGWVDQLYVAQTHWRRGIGRILLDHAKAAQPAGLQLYCFQVNTRARGFYESQGFRIAKMTDGATNEEREPDILYAWSGA